MNRKCIPFLIAGISFLAPTAGAQTWQSGADIPVPVRAGNTAAYSKNGNGHLYIASGRNTEGAIIKTMQHYNLNANTWDTLAPHPTGLLGGGTAVLKDSLYIVGGVVSPPGAGQTTVYRYNIPANTWSQAADCPFAVVDAKAVSYKDSLIYIAGGYGGADSGNVCVYNAQTNTWRQATPIPTNGRINFGGFAISGDTLIYMCGTDYFLSPTYFNTVYLGIISATDKSVINWIQGAPFPGNTRSFFDAHNWGTGRIIMTGGSTDNTFNSPSDECYLYKTADNSWTPLPSKPKGWLTGQSGSVQLPGNTWKLICVSGYDTVYLKDNEIFTMPPPPVSVSEQKKETGRLAQNVPNPFHNETFIGYTLTAPGQVRLSIYDIAGKKVREIASGTQPAGPYTFRFKRDGLQAGIYYYTARQEDQSATRIMVISE
jgi:N-acetylneuraminic acid mutarotase